MVFLESALDSKLNPLVALGRNGSLGLSGFVNKFNADAELLDDLVRITNREVRNTFSIFLPERPLDSQVTQGTVFESFPKTSQQMLIPREFVQRERNWLILELQQYARATHARVSFISGDVHCAAVGLLKTWIKEKKKPDIPPPLDHRYMVNIVSSTCIN